ncbi:MAG: triose-phosphate isomerase [Xylophilus ampelinus]
MSKQRQLIAGNWKMNGSLGANTALVRALVDGIGEGAACDVALAVPAPYFGQVRGLLGDAALAPIALAAQDVSAHASGAYTGEVSAAMLQDFGVRYAIVGHSERRQYHGETDAVVAAKAQRALASGLVPIVCVGETLAEREAGQGEAVVIAQLDAVVERLRRDGGDGSVAGIVVAYEPVWAIGTGKTATPAQAQEIHAALRGRLRQADEAAGAGVRLLYGGSMNAANAAELLAQPDIDGGLVGGASLKAADFLAIVAAAR